MKEAQNILQKIKQISKENLLRGVRIVVAEALYCPSYAHHWNVIKRYFTTALIFFIFLRISFIKYCFHVLRG